MCTASQLFSGKLGANRSTNAKSHTPTTSPAPEATRQSNQQPRQHHTPTRINRITNPHQPHHQHQKPRANQASSPGNTTHHQQQKPHTNHITSTRSHAPIKPAAPATSHINPQQPQHQHQKPHTDHITGAGKPRANQASSPGNTTHQPASTAAPTPGTSTRNHAPPAQRFLYCDGETPNISLKYFAKYFCVPKPTASETSTTLSPASVDNS